MAERELRGAVVAVVGAAGGLGQPIVAHLADRGAVLVLAGPHRDRLERIRPTPDALVVELDIRDPNAGDALAEAVSARFGRLDGLVDAAGVVAFGNLVDTPDEVIEELFYINVLGPLWLAKRMVPLLAASRGFLLMISAVLAEQPLPGLAAYGASKAAVSSAARAMARELRRQGITVIDARPPHTESGLAGRAISGTAPPLPPGLDPQVVAERLIRAVEAGERELPSAAFLPSD